METVEVWEQTLRAVKTHVSKPSYETWLKATNVHAIENNTMFIEAPNEFAKDWLADQYEALLSSIVQEITGHPYELTFVVQDPSMKERIRTSQTSTALDLQLYQQGAEDLLKKQIQLKLNKHLSVEYIADSLEVSLDDVIQLIEQHQLVAEH